MGFYRLEVSSAAMYIVRDKIAITVYIDEIKLRGL